VGWCALARFALTFFAERPHLNVPYAVLAQNS
jgi:hypothetical protein